MSEIKEKKKLSASTIKYLLEDPYKFVNKFALGIDVEDFNLNFVIGQCLHRIAEHFSNTGELSKDVAFILLSDTIENNTYVDEDGSDVFMFTDDELATIVNIIDQTFENMNGCVIPGGETELKIEDDDFVGYIDLLKDGWIIDYKFVSKFNTKGGMFDSMPGYIIQMSVYSRRYYNKYGEYPKGCCIIEVKKGDTTITDPQYIKKDLILRLIAEQHPYEDVDQKWTKDKLVQTYPIRDVSNQKIIFKVDDKFIALGDFIINKSILIRDLVLEFKRSQDTERKKEINRKIKIERSKFKSVVMDYVNLYYNQHLINDY